MWRPNGRENSRLGISVGRAFGASVIRNRFKRLAREAFRHACDLRAAGVDVVIVARQAAVLDGPSEIAQSMARILEQVRGVKRERDV
jgi:ribonuclease P protein component